MPSQDKTLTLDRRNLSISCKMHRTTSQSITSGGAFQNVVFDTIVYENGDWQTDLVGSPDQIIIPVDGEYSFCGHVKWDSNNAGQRDVVIRKNGVSIIRLFDIPGRTGSIYINPVYKDECDAGDVITLAVFQTSGVALNLLSEGDFSPGLVVALEHFD